MRYGIPYKGSKNALVEKLIPLFPGRKNFYDLFCGGCAVTHGAILSGKFQNYIINDLNPLLPKLFWDATHGKYKNESRWISREDFEKSKDTDGYIKYSWSFGNNGRSYLYSKEIEPWKKALHYARVHKDFSFLHDFGIETNNADRITISRNKDEYKEKYIKWYVSNVLHSDYDIENLRLDLTRNIKQNSEKLRNYLIEGLKKANKRPCDVDRYLGTNGMAAHYFGKSQWEFPTREVYIKLQDFIYLPRNYDEIYGLQELLESLQSLQSLESLQRLQSLESLESLQSLERLESLQSLESLQRLNKSYDEIEIKPDSLIYCDIPYRNTDGYNEGGFNHDKFYEWAKSQKELTLISEYWMPENDFKCVAEFNKRCTFSATANNVQTVERLYVPKTQLDMWLPLKIEIKRYKQLEFNFD